MERIAKIANHIPRNIIGESSKTERTAKEIWITFVWDIHSSRVRAVTANSGTICHVKEQRALQLTVAHKSISVEWAHEYVRFPNRGWRQIIFLDKKKQTGRSWRIILQLARYMKKETYKHVTPGKWRLFHITECVFLACYFWTCYFKWTPKQIGLLFNFGGALFGTIYSHAPTN